MRCRQAPYLVNATTGDAGWVKWAQHFCNPACHRDALAQVRLPL